MAFITQRKVSIRERQIIINESLGQNRTDQQIADSHHLSPRTTDEYRRRYLKNGHVLTEFELLKKNGPVTRAKIFDNAQLSNHVMNECLLHPKQSLDKYVDNIYDNFGFYASPSTIDRFFKSNKIKMKRLSPTAKEADLTEQYLFWQCIQTFMTDPRQMLFLDESSRDDKTPNKRRGRGPPGPVHADVSFTRGTYRYSFILAVHVSGIKAYGLRFGGYNGEAFMKFLVEDVLPLMRPYPEPFS